MKHCSTIHLLGAFLMERVGHRAAGYFLDEDAAALVGVRAGHHSRALAATALDLGASVTLDVNYNGCLSIDQPSYHVHLVPGAGDSFPHLATGKRHP